MAAATGSGFVDSFRRMPENRQRWIVRIVTFVLVVTIWEAIGQMLGSLFFAPLSEVIPTYIEMATDGEMFSLLLNTLKEMFIGFIVATAVGLPIGLLMGRSLMFEELLNPWISAFFVTATASLLPLFVVLFGIDFNFRLAIIFWGTVWYVLLNTYHGAKGVDTEYLDVGRTFEASPLKVYTDIVIPGTLPFIFAGLRIGLIHSLRGVILAETFIHFGYGGLIAQYANLSANTRFVLALILTIMVLGYVLRLSLEKIEDYLFPWTEETGTFG